IGNGRAKGKSRLFPLLQQEGIDAVLDPLLSADLHQLSFLGRKGPENGSISVAGVEQIAPAGRQVLAETLYILQNTRLDLVDLIPEGQQHRVVLGRLLAEPFILYFEVV